MKRTATVHRTPASQPPLKRWHLVALLIFVAIVYLPALRNGFLLDDFSLLHERTTRIESSGHPADIVLKPYWFGVQSSGQKDHLYRPWISFTHWFEHQMAGRSPFIYHLSNLLVHLANVFLLFVLLRPHIRPERAMIVAGLFAVSPAVLTAVGWISGRTDLWALCFSLCFLISMRRTETTRRRYYFAAGLLSFFLALCSKETAVIAPLLLLIMESVEQKHAAAAVNVQWKKYFALAIPLGIYVVLWQYAVRGTNAPPLDVNQVVSGLPFLAEQYLRTALHILFPVRFSFFNELTWSLPGQRGLLFLFSWLVLLGAVVLVFHGLRRGQWWAVGGAWFGLMLFVPYASGQTFAPLSDFYAYAAVPGLWLFVVVGVYALAETRTFRLTPMRIRAVSVIAAVVIAVFGVLTFYRLPLLKSGLDLMTHTVKAEPTSGEAAKRLSDEYFAEGQTGAGLQWLERAVELNPSFVEWRVKAAVAYMDMNESAAANPHITAIRELAPNDLTCRAVLARYFYKSGRCADAIRQYEELLVHAEPAPLLFYNYGMALQCDQQDSLAIVAFRQTLRLDPVWPAAWEALAKVSIRMGRLDDAQAAAEQYYRLSPSPERTEQLRALLAAAKAHD